MRYCKSTSFQANHNVKPRLWFIFRLFAILQKYEFSSKSQRLNKLYIAPNGCLRYCKSTSFQANHNVKHYQPSRQIVVCDTAKVRVFKQITTRSVLIMNIILLFAILQKYEFSSKSQPQQTSLFSSLCCLRYCKSTSFQANHNSLLSVTHNSKVVCDTAKVRVFKQITTRNTYIYIISLLFAILQKYEFSSKSQLTITIILYIIVVCDTAKVRVFKQITTDEKKYTTRMELFAILQKYEFSSKSQPNIHYTVLYFVVCDTAKVRVFKQITTLLPFELF